MPKSENPQPITLAQVKSEADLMQALAIRKVVFIEEQHVPEGIERDSEDARAYHVLALQGGHAIGTGRLVMLPEPPPGQQGQWAQIGRMAVLQSHRKARVGSLLLKDVEMEAKRRGVNGIMLHAQLYALEFYRKHGYADGRGVPGSGHRTLGDAQAFLTAKKPGALPGSPTVCRLQAVSGGLLLIV